MPVLVVFSFLVLAMPISWLWHHPQRGLRLETCPLVFACWEIWEYREAGEWGRPIAQDKNSTFCEDPHLAFAAMLGF